MKDKVLVTINGIQHDIDNNDGIRTIQPGKYKLVSNKHVVKYDEYIEDNDSNAPIAITNFLKIDSSSNMVTLTKKGASSSNMVFQEGYHHDSLYQTPFGAMQMSLYTTGLTIEENDESINISIKYSLAMNKSHVSDCSITINIESI